MAGCGTITALEIDEFINGALVSWLESCLPRPEILSGYPSLLDGSIIHSVWLQIDPEPQHNPVDIPNLAGTSLRAARAKNFECIVRNLKALFEEEFGQTLLVLPDPYQLGYHPETKQGLEQMKLLLTLLLGAAVQCPNNEVFIARIKELDVGTQQAIVELIKQVTDNHSLVLTSESVNLLTPTAMYNHILRLTKERDRVFMKWIETVCSEPEVNASRGEDDHGGVNGGDSGGSGAGGGGGGGGLGGGSRSMPMSPSNGRLTASSSMSPSASSNSESSHMAVELADLKSKLRKLRQELEEKAENQLELREELEHKTTQYEKLRAESQEWYAEAKRSAAYRDEVDVLRERAERADRLEIEVQKFREKLTDAEFYKTRVEELREDNRMLLETKEMLEDQLQRSRKRSEHVMTLESEIIKYKQKLNDMALERDVDRSKLEELLEENTQLQLVAKNLNATQEADKSLSDNDDDCNSGDNSLSEQLTNSAQTRALKLELENRRLTAALDQLKETNFHESTTKILELEKEKKKLSLKVEQMQENIQRLTQQNVELETVFKNALEENKKLQDSLDNRQKSYDRQSQERELERNKMIDLEKQVETLTKEKQRVQTLNESIQRRADDLERLLGTKTKEVDQLMEKTRDFDRTREALYAAEAKTMTYERENGSLVKEVLKLKENIEEKSVQLDETATKLATNEKDVQRLQRRLEIAEQTNARVAELEKQNQDLISQHEIDLETLSTLRNDLVTGTLATNRVRHSLERLGLTVDQSTDDGGNGGELNVETVVEKLVRNPETFKTVREIMLNVTKEQQRSGGVGGDDDGSGGTSKSDMCVLCHRQEIFTVEKNIELSGSSEPQELTFEHKTVRSAEHMMAAVSASASSSGESSRRMSEVNSQLNTANIALQSTNDQLQAENARMRVDVATLGSQITSLNTQHVALQLANSQLAADKDALTKQIDAVRQEFKNSQHDQVTLQCLHDQLSAEYDALNKSKEQLKMLLRDSRNETRELRDRIASLEEQIAELSRQNAGLKSCSEDLSILRTEHSRLTDDFRNLFATSDRFKNEYKNIQEQYKMIRMENSKMKLRSTELTGELNAKSDQVKMLEIEYTKVAQRCEMLLQMNADLDTDRKTLMENVSQLLSQYHELLSHSLEDKQHFHEEEKSYTERVHNLSRQKEKLEEKIMEHYKKSESTIPKKKPFASSLVRRVKKASSDLMNKVPSRNRRSWVDDSRLAPSSQFMIGSESGGNDSDNSTEEPMSIASDTHLLQRNMPMRQSLQRLEAPDVTGSSLTLGTAGSRRTVYLIDELQKIPDPNATGTATGSGGNGGSGGNSGSGSNSSSISAAATVGNHTNNNGSINSNNLPAGAVAVTAANASTTTITTTAEPQTPTTATTAGIPAKTDGSSSAAAAAGSSASAISNAGPSGGSAAAGAGVGIGPGGGGTPVPNTFLMYNRINTMIGGTGGSSAGGINGGLDGQQQQSDADKMLRKRPTTAAATAEDKSNSIWYEYGCV